MQAGNFSSLLMMKIVKMRTCVIGVATAESINFMAKYAVVNLPALTRLRTEQLGLTMMERRNESRHETVLPFRLRLAKVLPLEFLR